MRSYILLFLSAYANTNTEAAQTNAVEQKSEIKITEDVLSNLDSAKSQSESHTNTTSQSESHTNTTSQSESHTNTTSQSESHKDNSKNNTDHIPNRYKYTLHTEQPVSNFSRNILYILTGSLAIVTSVILYVRFFHTHTVHTSLTSSGNHKGINYDEIYSSISHIPYRSLAETSESALFRSMVQAAHNKQAPITCSDPAKLTQAGIIPVVSYQNTACAVFIHNVKDNAKKISTILDTPEQSQIFGIMSTCFIMSGLHFVDNITNLHATEVYSFEEYVSALQAGLHSLTLTQRRVEEGKESLLDTLKKRLKQVSQSKQIDAMEYTTFIRQCIKENATDHATAVNEALLDTSISLLDWCDTILKSEINENTTADLLKNSTRDCIHYLQALPSYLHETDFLTGKYKTFQELTKKMKDIANVQAITSSIQEKLQTLKHYLRTIITCLQSPIIPVDIQNEYIQSYFMPTTMKFDVNKPTVTQTQDYIYLHTDATTTFKHMSKKACSNIVLIPVEKLIEIMHDAQDPTTIERSSIKLDLPHYKDGKSKPNTVSATLNWDFLDSAETLKVVKDNRYDPVIRQLEMIQRMLKAVSN